MLHHPPEVGSAVTLESLAHELALRDELDPAWAARAIALDRECRDPVLFREDPGGVPLAAPGAPLAIGEVLRLAVAIAAALGEPHHRGLVHKELYPANLLVDRERGTVRLHGGLVIAAVALTARRREASGVR